MGKMEELIKESIKINLELDSKNQKIGELVYELSQELKDLIKPIHVEIIDGLIVEELRSIKLVPGLHRINVNILKSETLNILFYRMIICQNQAKYSEIHNDIHRKVIAKFIKEHLGESCVDVFAINDSPNLCTFAIDFKVQ